MKEYANQIVADSEEIKIKWPKGLEILSSQPAKHAERLARELVTYAAKHREDGEIMVIRVGVKIGTRDELFPRQETTNADAL